MNDQNASHDETNEKSVGHECLPPQHTSDTARVQSSGSPLPIPCSTPRQQDIPASAVIEKSPDNIGGSTSKEAPSTENGDASPASPAKDQRPTHTDRDLAGPSSSDEASQRPSDAVVDKPNTPAASPTIPVQSPDMETGNGVPNTSAETPSTMPVELQNAENNTNVSITPAQSSDMELESKAPNTSATIPSTTFMESNNAENDDNTISSTMSGDSPDTGTNGRPIRVPAAMPPTASDLSATLPPADSTQRTPNTVLTPPISAAIPPRPSIPHQCQSYEYEPAFVSHIPEEPAPERNGVTPHSQPRVSCDSIDGIEEPMKPYDERTFENEEPPAVDVVGGLSKTGEDLAPLNIPSSKSRTPRSDNCFSTTIAISSIIITIFFGAWAIFSWVDGHKTLSLVRYQACIAAEVGRVLCFVIKYALTYPKGRGLNELANECQGVLKLRQDLSKRLGHFGVPPPHGDLHVEQNLQSPYLFDFLQVFFPLDKWISITVAMASTLVAWVDTKTSATRPRAFMSIVASIFGTYILFAKCIHIETQLHTPIPEDVSFDEALLSYLRLAKMDSWLYGIVMTVLATLIPSMIPSPERPGLTVNILILVPYMFFAYFFDQQPAKLAYFTQYDRYLSSDFEQPYRFTSLLLFLGVCRLIYMTTQMPPSSDSSVWEIDIWFLVVLNYASIVQFWASVTATPGLTPLDCTVAILGVLVLVIHTVWRYRANRDAQK